MVDFTKMDQMEQKLFEDHSLAALEYLIERGRELEFDVQEHSCFLSKYETAEYVSLWVDQEEQSFSSMTELFEKARIGNVSFAESWGTAELKTLF